jgi:hypothetical protein
LRMTSERTGQSSFDGASTNARCAAVETSL